MPSLFLYQPVPSKALSPRLLPEVMLPPDPGEDVLDVVQNCGWEAASEPKARRSRAEQHNMAGTAGLSATLLYRELGRENTTRTFFS